MAANQLATLCVLVATLAGCAAPSRAPTQAIAPDGSAPSAQAARKQIAIAIAGEPSTLNDTINQSSSGGTPGVAETGLLLNTGIVELDGQQTRPFPVLGESVPTVDNGLWRLLPDGRMQTVHTLRADAAWHDGTGVSSDDLLFTIQAGMDPEVGVLANAGFRYIESAQAQDARTVVVNWKQPYIAADTLFGVAARFAGPLPKHILGPVYEQDRANLPRAPYFTQEFVGAGPFKLRDFVSGSHMILTANDAFVLGRPKIDQIEVRFILDGNTQIANLLAGEVLMTMGRRLSIEQGQQAAARWPEGRMLVSTQNWIAFYPQFISPQPPILIQPQFRRALMYLADRQQMSDALSNGLAPPADSMVSPGTAESQATTASVVRYPFDPAQGASILESLGYRKGADGRYADTTGRPLSMEIRTTAGDDFRGKMITTVADDWQRGGIGIEINIVPRQRADDLEYRSTRPGLELVRQPMDPTRFYSREVPLPENGFRGNNRTRLQNAELDGIIDRYFTTIPFAPRMQALSEFVRFTTDQLVVMGMLYNAEPILVSNRIQNVIPAAADPARDTWNAYQWDLTP